MGFLPIYRELSHSKNREKQNIGKAGNLILWLWSTKIENHPLHTL
jgi:hypothetical protein